MLVPVGRVKTGVRAAIRKIWVARASEVANLYFDTTHRITRIQMHPNTSWKQIDFPAESCFVSQSQSRNQGSTRISQQVAFTPGAMNPITRFALYHLAQECAVHVLAKQDDGQILYLGISYDPRRDLWHTEKMKVRSGNGNSGRNRSSDSNTYAATLGCTANFHAPFYIGGLGSLDIEVSDPVEVEDLTPPTLVIPSPADGATVVPIKPTLTAIFSERITTGTGTIFLRKYSDDSPVHSWNVALPADVELIAPDQIELAERSALEFGTRYYLDIPSGAIADLSAQNYAGTGSKDTWDFTTQEAPPAAPLLSSSTPSGGATGYDPSIALQLTFDQTAKEGQGFFLIRGYSDDTPIASISVLDSRVSIAGAVVSIDLDGLLSPLTRYYILAEDGIIENVQGVAWVNTLDDKNDLDFTTSDFGVDPTITLYEPANVANNQSQAPTIRLTFDSPITLDTGTAKLIRAVDLGGEPSDGGNDVLIKSWDVSTGTDLTQSVGDTVLEFTNFGTLDPSQSYYLTWPGTAFKNADNRYITAHVRPGQGPPEWIFSVADAQQITYSPSPGGTPVNNSVDPSISSSQAQRLTDGTDKWVRAYDYDTDVLIWSLLIPANAADNGPGYRFDGNSLYFERIPFSSANRIYITMDEGVLVNLTTGVKSPALTDKSQWEFTLVIDTSDPFLTGYNPAAGTEIDETTSLVLSLIISEWALPVAGKKMRIYRGSDGVCVYERDMGDGSWSAYDATPSESGSAFWQHSVPPDTFAANEDYFIHLEAGAFVDTCGNELTAYTLNNYWFKTTGSTTVNNSGFGAPTGEPNA